MSIKDKSLYKTNWWDIKTEEEAYQKVVGCGPSHSIVLDHFKWKDEPKEIVSFIRAYTPKGSRLLEFGCGVGRVTHYLKDDFDVAIFDESEQVLKVHPHRHVSVSQIYRVSSFEGDAILSCYVLQHLPIGDQLHVLGEFRAAKWKYFFMLETDDPQDFPDHNFHNVFNVEGLQSKVVVKMPWRFEPNCFFTVFERLT